MDDRDGVIWFNGQLVPWREAKVHVLVHSLHYGNAVFEGERIYGGKVFKLTEHSARLHQVRQHARLRTAVLGRGTRRGDETRRRREQARQRVRPAARVARAGGHRRVGDRHEGSRGDRGVPVGRVLRAEGDQARHQPVEAAQPRKLARREQGRRASTSSARSPRTRPSPPAARTRLMHDYKGRLSEATGANLFLLINGELHTPDHRDHPERHHAPDGDRTGPQARDQGDRARNLAGRTREGDRSVPHRHRGRGAAGRRDRPAQLRGRPGHAAVAGGLRGAGARVIVGNGTKHNYSPRMGIRYADLLDVW